MNKDYLIVMLFLKARESESLLLFSAVHIRVKFKKSL